MAEKDPLPTPPQFAPDRVAQLQEVGINVADPAQLDFKGLWEKLKKLIGLLEGFLDVPAPAPRQPFTPAQQQEYKDVGVDVTQPASLNLIGLWRKVKLVWDLIQDLVDSGFFTDLFNTLPAQGSPPIQG